MKSIRFGLLVALLAAGAQAQQYKLNTDHFELILPISTSLYIYTSEGSPEEKDSEWGASNQNSIVKTTTYLSGNSGADEFISVRTIDHDIPMTQEVADFYSRKGVTTDTFKDSEGWVYNVVSRTRGHLDASATTFTKDGKMGTQPLAQYWTLITTKYVDLDDKSSHLQRQLVAVVDSRTVITITLTTPLDHDVPAYWDTIWNSLKLKPHFISK